MKQFNNTPRFGFFHSEVSYIIECLKRPATKIQWFTRLISVAIPLSFLAIVLLQPWYDKRLMFFDTITAAEFSNQCCSPYFGFVSSIGIFLYRLLRCAWIS